MASLSSYKEKVNKAEQITAMIGGSDKIFIHGDIDVNTPTRIMCSVEGNIKSDSKIVISTNGSIKGDIKAADLVIEEGRVTGNIVAERVTIASGAVVSGDITTSSISIISGASFTGSVRKPLISDSSKYQSSCNDEDDYDDSDSIESKAPMCAGIPLD